MEIKFTKMHGLGNDFMVINAVSQNLRLHQKDIRFLAHRQRGIGFDQCLIVEPATTPDVDFNYRIFNADGGEVEQCGNGARCLARFIADNGLSHKKRLIVTTLNRKLELLINPDNSVTVNLGEPRFVPAAIPLNNFPEQAIYTINGENYMVSFHALSLGNPHAVVLVDNINTAAIEELGEIIGKHPCFPKGANVGFMQIVDKHYMKLRVIERGVGETLACGSGACAAMICGKRFHDMAEKITVELPGGYLHISWLGIGHPVLLTGTATKVYEGTVTL